MTHISHVLKKKSRTKLETFAEACGRMGISGRVASFISSSMLVSYKKDDVSAVIDENMIRRAKKTNSF